MKVAYWDTEQRARPPALLGEIKGTPTIRAFKPRRQSSTNKKEPIEYNQAREVKDLLRFSTMNMPNFAERVENADQFAKVLKKAEEWGLPLVLLFSKSSATSTTIKVLSAEFRRRLIIVDVKQGTRTEALAKKYAVTSFPSLLAYPSNYKQDEEPLRFDSSKEPSYFRLSTFFSKVALRKQVLSKKPTPREEHPKEEL